MRITIDARLYGLENKGIGRYVKHLVEELQKIDNENEYTLILKPKYYKKLQVPDNWNKINCNIREYSLIEQFKLKNIIEKTKPDLVHYPQMSMPYFCKCDFVLTLHDLTQIKFNKNATKRNIFVYISKIIGLRLLLNKQTKNARKIIVPTKTIKKEIEKKYSIDSKKVKVTYEGFPLFNKKVSKDVKSHFDIRKPYFLYVGGNAPHKNLAFAISAFLKFNSAHNDKYEFVLVTNKDSTFINKVVSTNKSIKIIDFVSDRELISLFKSSISLVFPSVKEGFGLPGIEAMAAGTLVVASKIPVFKEVYADNAIYFNPRNEHSFISKLNEVIIMSKKERIGRIKKGQEFVEKYSWGKMAQKTLAIYKKVYTDVVS